MKYLDFLCDPAVTAELIGSDLEAVLEIEKELGIRIPSALKEYLLIMGEKTCLYPWCDEHGTKDMVMLHGWMNDWIFVYRSKGMDLKELMRVLPFFKFQDTFFYLRAEEEDENPPVYAFDINVTPTLRKLSDTFADFVKANYENYLRKQEY